jgi:crotonobetainyl-CoA:carnitine CoA-transferase CaiB-like acyl-CoA transferase
MDTNLNSALSDLTVLEIGDQSGEYAALLLGGLGADIIKVEPPGGAPSRRIGPYASGEPDPEQSMFFWRYNLGKRSLVLDLDAPSAAPAIERLVAKASVVLISGEFADAVRQIEKLHEFTAANPRLIVCSITPFGLTGPYRELKMTDLTQLAMGGIMAVCGYDPKQDGTWDTPPIAPAMWHSYHIAGEYACAAILAALNFRDLVGEGQSIDVSIHEAVSTCTEIAIPTYIYNGLVVKRQTARHAAIGITQFRLSVSKDNVYVLASLTPFEREETAFKQLADQSGIEHVLGAPEYAQLEKEDRRAALTYRNDLIEQVVGSMTAEEVFNRAQRLGLAWSPIRRPEDNLSNEHFSARRSFAKINDPEIGRDLLYPQTVATDGHEPHMKYERRAPTLGEHTTEIFNSLGFGDRPPAQPGSMHHR